MKSKYSFVTIVATELVRQAFTARREELGSTDKELMSAIWDSVDQEVVKEKIEALQAARLAEKTEKLVEKAAKKAAEAKPAKAPKAAKEAKPAKKAEKTSKASAPAKRVRPSRAKITKVEQSELVDDGGPAVMVVTGEGV